MHMGRSARAPDPSAVHAQACRGTSCEHSGSTARCCKMHGASARHQGGARARLLLEGVDPDHAAYGRAAGSGCGVRGGLSQSCKHCSARSLQDGCKMAGLERESRCESRVRTVAWRFSGVETTLWADSGQQRAASGQRRQQRERADEERRVAKSHRELQPNLVKTLKIVKKKKMGGRGGAAR